jgi:hypothetical protein
MTPIEITIPLYYSPLFGLIFGALALFVGARVAIRLWDLIGV